MVQTVNTTLHKIKVNFFYILILFFSIRIKNSDISKDPHVIVQQIVSMIHVKLFTFLSSSPPPPPSAPRTLLIVCIYIYHCIYITWYIGYLVIIFRKNTISHHQRKIWRLILAYEQKPTPPRGLLSFVTTESPCDNLRTLFNKTHSLKNLTHLTSFCVFLLLL